MIVNEILEYIEEMTLSQAALSKVLGVSRDRFNCFLRQKDDKGYDLKKVETDVTNKFEVIRMLTAKSSRNAGSNDESSDSVKIGFNIPFDENNRNLHNEVGAWIEETKISKKAASKIFGVGHTTFNKFLRNQQTKHYNYCNMVKRIAPTFYGIQAVNANEITMQDAVSGTTQKIGFTSKCELDQQTESNETAPAIGFGQTETKPSSTDKSLKLALKSFMEEEKFSNKQIAKMLSVSAATLSEWLKNKYNGDNEKVNKAVRSFLSRQQEIVVNPQRGMQFEQTITGRVILDVANLCHANCEVGVVTGDAGVGKTFALKKYAEDNPEAIFIEVDPGCSGHTLMKAIAKEVGANPSGSTQDLFEQIVDKLKGSERLIILDEAEEVEYDGLNRLRRIYDKAGVGILLVGMPRLIYNLRGRKAEHTQLYSRNTIAVEVGSLELEDTEKLVTQILPEVSGKLIKIFHAACKQNARVLKHLIFNALKVSRTSGKPLDTETIKKLARYLIYK